MSQIISIKLTRETGILPVRGILTSKLNIKLFCSETFPAGSEIYLYDASDTQILPVFYISKPDYGDGIANITAYDNCRSLDLFFDTSSIFTEWKEYDIPLVMGKIASECGFTGATNTGFNIDKIHAKFLHNKTCRSILNLISEAGCGMWHCNNDNFLEFKPFGKTLDLCTLDEQNTCNFRRGSIKGPINALRIINPLDDESYQIGYDSGYNSILKLEGKLIDKSVSEKILTNVKGVSYLGFSCEKAITNVIPDALCNFSYKDTNYSALSIITEITPYGYVNKISAVSLPEDRFDYVGSVEYSLADRVLYEKKCGSSIISMKGLQFTDNENTFGFDVKSGGVTLYEGTNYSENPAKNVTVSDDESTLSYNIGNTSVSMAITWDGDNIKSISRTIKNGGTEVYTDKEEESTS